MDGGMDDGVKGREMMGRGEICYYGCRSHIYSYRDCTLVVLCASSYSSLASVEGFLRLLELETTSVLQ